MFLRVVKDWFNPSDVLICEYLKYVIEQAPAALHIHMNTVM